MRNGSERSSEAMRGQRGGFAMRREGESDAEQLVASVVRMARSLAGIAVRTGCLCDHIRFTTVPGQSPEHCNLRSFSAYPAAGFHSALRGGSGMDFETILA
ncbi:hypothetical protein Tco_0527711 [Tanacetum coccineum]